MDIESFMRSIPKDKVERAIVINKLLISIEENDIEYEMNIKIFQRLSSHYWSFYIQNRNSFDKEERFHYWLLLIKIDFSLSELLKTFKRDQINKMKGSDFSTLVSIPGLILQKDIKFTDYTLRLLWLSLVSLIEKLNDMILTEELIEYIEVLYRNFCKISCLVYDDTNILNFTIFVKKDDKNYSVNRKFIDEIEIIFFEIKDKISYYTMFISDLSQTNLFSISQQEQENFYLILKKTGDGVQHKQVKKEFKKTLFRNLLRIGELEFCKNSQTYLVSDPNSVISATRPDYIEEVAGWLYNTQIDLFEYLNKKRKEKINNNKNYRPEDYINVFYEELLIHSVSFFIEQVFGGFSLQSYIHRFNDDRYFPNQTKYVNFPVIIRAFNQYIVIFNNQPRLCLNIESAIILWLTKIYFIQLTYQTLNQNKPFLSSKNLGDVKILKLKNKTKIFIPQIFTDKLITDILESLCPGRLKELDGYIKECSKTEYSNTNKSEIYL